MRSWKVSPGDTEGSAWRIRRRFPGGLDGRQLLEVLVVAIELDRERLVAQCGDLCPRRAAPRPCHDIIDRIERALQQRLNAAVGAVAHPPIDTALFRFAAEAISIADT